MLSFQVDKLSPTIEFKIFIFWRFVISLITSFATYFCHVHMYELSLLIITSCTIVVINKCECNINLDEITLDSIIHLFKVIILNSTLGSISHLFITISNWNLFGQFPNKLEFVWTNSQVKKNGKCVFSVLFFQH
jgi:hypothetical protein